MASLRPMPQNFSYKKKSNGVFCGSLSEVFQNLREQKTSQVFQSTNMAVVVTRMIVNGRNFSGSTHNPYKLTSSSPIEILEFSHF